jgi:alkanesulfonate monooxygenase SsuD/methylene tetrahydromethanopterin reductase-like flavin-dependent oxidoreductase (luciferase family)
MKGCELMSVASLNPTREIRFGLLVPGGVLSELRGIEPVRQNQAIRDYVVRAEHRGFHSVWVSDHVHQIRPQDVGGSLEAWTILSAVSQYTERVKLGQLVMCVPFRNPALLAKMAASLDVLSGGRLILGLGAGWYEAEFNGYGYDFLPPPERLAALREGIGIICGMLAGERVDFSGAHFRVAQPQCEPAPIQAHIPLLIGGHGKVTLRIVAQHADLANFTGTLETFIEAQQRLDTYCAQCGRDPAAIERTWMTLGILVRETQREVDQVLERFRQMDDARLIRNQIAGTPERVTEELSKFTERGCEQLVFGLTEAPSTEIVDLFAETVMPAFAPSVATTSPAS